MRAKGRIGALQRICPTCGAFAGQPCIGGRSGARIAMHRARYVGEAVTRTVRTMSYGMTEYDLIEAEVQASITRYEEKLRNQIERSCAVCESPIERVFMAALIVYNQLTPFDDFAHIYLKPGEEVGPPPFDGIHVYPQAKVDGYRIDFLFAVQRNGVVRYTVVELDGHDFHERTKRQASHDKARDRHFTKKGWLIARFTGSDVWRDPGECVGEVFVIAQELGPFIP